MELSIEQQRAIALAKARVRAAQPEPETAAEPVPAAMAGGTDPSMMDAAAFGAAQGMTFNTSDEIEAGLRTGFGLAGDYDETLDEVRANMEAARAKHPWLFLGSEVAGGVGTGAGLLKGGLSLTGRAVDAGRGVLMRGGAASVEGAAAGGLYGAGAGTTADERLEGAKQGAKVGAVLGPVAEAGGSLVARALPGKKARNLGRLDPAAREGVEAAEKFDIPLTRGQATGDIGQQAFEEAARHGSKGTVATNVLTKQDKTAADAAERAQETLQRGFGGTAIDAPQEAGEAAVEALTSRAASLKQQGRRAYEAAEAMGATIDADAVQVVPAFIRNVLDAEGEVIDATLHPAASFALRRAEDWVGNIRSQDGDVLAVSLKRLDRLRQVVKRNRGAPGSDDARLVKKITAAYDGWFEAAVDTALFSGDEAALAELKRARGLWSHYRSLTTPQTGDDAGSVIAKMIERDTDPIEATNYLLGVSKTGASGRAVRVVSQLRNEFGADSEPINSLRQAMWLKMTRNAEGKTQPGPQAIAQTISEFVDGKGSAMAKVLYTPRERAQMRRFARAMRALVTNPKAMNPSRSGYRVMDALKSTSSDLAGMLGLTSFGIEGGLAAKFGLPLLTGGRNAMQARRNVSAPVPTVNQLPGAVVGAGAGVNDHSVMPQ
jgi:hypothetical protein